MAVFAKGEDAAAATAAGADIVGGEDLLASVMEGDLHSHTTDTINMPKLHTNSGCGKERRILIGP